MDNWYVSVNGQQLGPMGWEQVKAMAREGRMNPHDGIYNPGTEQWSPAGTIPGLQFAPPSGHGAPSDPLMRAVVPIGQSGLAIIASYLGLLSLACIPAPFAILIGVLALQDIKRNPQKTGAWRAWFGIICGVLGLIGLAWLIIQRNAALHPSA